LKNWLLQTICCSVGTKQVLLVELSFLFPIVLKNSQTHYFEIPRRRKLS
jgi:hypothetical protein